MSDFTLYILTALALVFVIEGLMYALFPDFVRKMMAMAVMMDVRKLRFFGLIMASLGLLTIWLMDMAQGG